MNDFIFHRDGIQTFRFVRTGFNAETGHAELVYAFDHGAELIETLVFPGAPFALTCERRAAVERALQLVHLIAGVSYYKAAVPEKVLVETGELAPELAAFLVSVYENGLGEFAYRNGLSLRGKIIFPSSNTNVERAPKLGLSPTALTAIGGGKDSLVSVEALRAAGVAQRAAFIGSSPLIANCIEATGLPALNVQRQLSPLLFEFNKQGAYNGHIPVTAVNSAILVVAALLADAGQVVFSNERSASYGSLIPNTGEVNHQWSKGWAFERDFAAYVRGFIAADLAYYSLLRPLSELAVARQFAKTDRYDGVFSSCNRNFHLLGPKPSARWCGHCPKCEFVFLALAPFVPKPRLTTIFGGNLLDELALAPGFDALLEFEAHKPFECVGEGREVRAAFAELATRPAWREDALVDRFATQIAGKMDVEPLADLLALEGEHGIPAQVWESVREIFRA